METEILKKIGLTGSEIKVYLALLKLGLSRKGRILKEARIAPSKIYHVLHKLIEKGLVSMITKNNVKHFSASPPSRVLEFIRQQKEELTENEILFAKILPQLESVQKETDDETNVEVYIGWKGIQTVYHSFLKTMKRGDVVQILGAGTGPREEQFDLFFTKMRRMALRKGIKTKLIFNNDARDYVKRIEASIGEMKEKRFLFNHTPSEVLIYKEYVAILIRKSDPIIILIHDRETSESFMSYFEELWNIAKQ